MEPSTADAEVRQQDRLALVSAFLGADHVLLCFCNHEYTMLQERQYNRVSDASMGRLLCVLRKRAYVTGHTGARTMYFVANPFA
jgi:hypothetical protein